MAGLLKPIPYAFVICSHLESSRIPRKAFEPIAGIPIIKRLDAQLAETGLPRFYAVPLENSEEYEAMLPGATIVSGYPENPLARMTVTRNLNNIQNVIRVTHDKIFVDPDTVLEAIKVYEEGGHDYLYSSSIVPGCGFEIISGRLLEPAIMACKGKKVEHISYAVRPIAISPHDFKPSSQGLRITERFGSPRLLLDYPEDLAAMKEMFEALPEPTAVEAVEHFRKKRNKTDNRLPTLSIYTCAYNAEEWLEECIKSVQAQVAPIDGLIEYFIIDDCSTDKTGEIAEKLGVEVIRNAENMGLASSSNVALSRARGQFIMRLDADDYFSHPMISARMMQEMHVRKLEALYPNNYFGSFELIQKGSINHHVGGAMFDKRALNYLKFTSGLRGFEGYDLYKRARNTLKIGYHDRPTFYYRQRENSMSKECGEKRAAIKAEIDSRVQ